MYQLISQMFENYQKAISPQRLESYRQNGSDDTDTLTRCVWNIALCEAFYPSLQHLEVGLRNSLHHAAEKAFNDKKWFKRPFLCDKAKEDIRYAEALLKEKGKDFYDPGRVIAELNLGFWVRLFSKHYDRVLWGNKIFIHSAFPYANKKIRVRKILASRFNKIRQFRNRIFHYEPILRYNLGVHHYQILESMNWIEPSLYKTNKLIDRFHKVIDENYYRALREKLVTNSKI